MPETDQKIQGRVIPNIGGKDYENVSY